MTRNKKRLETYDFVRPLAQSVVLKYTAQEIIDLLAPKGIPKDEAGTLIDTEILR